MVMAVNNLPNSFDIFGLSERIEDMDVLDWGEPGAWEEFDEKKWYDLDKITRANQTYRVAKGVGWIKYAKRNDSRLDTYRWYDGEGGGCYRHQWYRQDWREYDLEREDTLRVTQTRLPRYVLMEDIVYCLDTGLTIGTLGGAVAVKSISKAGMKAIVTTFLKEVYKEGKSSVKEEVAKKLAADGLSELGPNRNGKYPTYALDKIMGGWTNSEEYKTILGQWRIENNDSEHFGRTQLHIYPYKNRCMKGVTESQCARKREDAEATRARFFRSFSNVIQH